MHVLCTCVYVYVCVYTNTDSFIIAKIDRRKRHKARKKNNGIQAVGAREMACKRFPIRTNQLAFESPLCRWMHRQQQKNSIRHFPCDSIARVKFKVIWGQLQVCRCRGRTLQLGDNDNTCCKPARLVHFIFCFHVVVFCFCLILFTPAVREAQQQLVSFVIVIAKCCCCFLSFPFRESVDNTWRIQGISNIKNMLSIFDTLA